MVDKEKLEHYGDTIFRDPQHYAFAQSNAGNRVGRIMECCIDRLHDAGMAREEALTYLRDFISFLSQM